MNFVPFEKVRIYFTPKHQSAGQHSILNGIELNAAETERDKANILWILIHEELHAVSQSGITVKQSEAGLSLISKTGVSTTINETSHGIDPENQKLNRVVNEGITEFITEIIYKEYIRRAGDFSELEIKQAQNTMSDSYAVDSYSDFRQNLDLYINLLALLSKASEEEIENGVVRAYLRNGLIMSIEVRELFDEKHPGLSEKIEELINNPESQLYDFAKYIDSLHILTPSESMVLWEKVSNIAEKKLEGLKNYMGR